MKIIRLQIERKWRGRSLQTIKHAVSLDPKKHPQIRHFLNHVCKLCELGDGPNELSVDGFAFSPTDRSKVLREGVVYKFKIDVNGCPKFERAREQKISKLIKSSSEEAEEDEEIEESQEEEIERGTIGKKGKIQKKTKSRGESIVKPEGKKSKKEKAKRKLSSSESDSSVSSDSSSSSSSSSSSQEAPAPRKLKKTEVVVPTKKEKSVPSKEERHVLVPQPSKSAPKQVKEPKKKEEPIVEKKIAPKKIPVPVPAVSSSESSDSSSDQLPQLGQKAPAKPAAEVHVPHKAEAEKKAVQQIANKPEQPSSGNSTLTKKKIIQDSSEEEAVKAVQQRQEKETPKIKMNANVKLPPALRNKITQKQVQKPKLSAWLLITKEKMQKWQQGGEKYFCKPKNRIRFKIIELDEERFVPVKSGWISGEVKDVTADGKVQLINVDQEGKGYKQHYDIPEFNMDELQISRAEATPQQILCLQGEEKPVEKVVQKKQEPSKEEVAAETGEKEGTGKAICGQLQFYFSDKSYLTDLYTQMHANRHPQKYLNISFLLNFPKIKKLIRDENKLLQYLKEDERYVHRSYEVDFENKLIRKKNIVAPPEVKPAPLEEIEEVGEVRQDEKPENRENAE